MPHSFSLIHRNRLGLKYEEERENSSDEPSKKKEEGQTLNVSI
jgi:hypothetical protein